MFTALAPHLSSLELVLGLAMAYLFLEKLPGRQIFISLLVFLPLMGALMSGFRRNIAARIAAM